MSDTCIMCGRPGLPEGISVCKSCADKVKALTPKPLIDQLVDADSNKTSKETDDVHTR